MHWWTVTPDVGVPAGMSLMTVTSQNMLLPPPVAVPLHWLIEVTSWLDLETVL
jgi:hypothetical protein